MATGFCNNDITTDHIGDSLTWDNRLVSDSDIKTSQIGDKIACDIRPVFNNAARGLSQRKCMKIIVIAGLVATASVIVTVFSVFAGLGKLPGQMSQSVIDSSGGPSNSSLMMTEAATSMAVNVATSAPGVSHASKSTQGQTASQDASPGGRSSPTQAPASTATSPLTPTTSMPEHANTTTAEEPEILTYSTTGSTWLVTCSWGCPGWYCKDYNGCIDPYDCTNNVCDGA
ncbi:hypothetical protein F4780DRAFT_573440 [Xylariomycetidae sp. FL0641]|nr:hypothetical protein F4780DRAFT_573440 [Xylariomycetidae sp. FL0641]